MIKELPMEINLKFRSIVPDIKTSVFEVPGLYKVPVITV